MRFHKGDIVYYPPWDVHDRHYWIIDEPAEDDKEYRAVEFEDGEDIGMIFRVPIEGAERWTA